EIIDIGIPITLTVAALPDKADVIDAGSIHFTRYLVKPGRAATLRQRWSLWALIQGVPVPPEVGNYLTGGSTEQVEVLNLPDGNYDVISQESMEIPRFFASYVSTVTLFYLRAQLFDDPSNVQLSNDLEIFADVQIGAVPGS
ncbi:MAG: hypothetical protein ACYTF1_19090, partial [Planctomycetota bacterium]